MPPILLLTPVRRSTSLCRGLRQKIAGAQTGTNEPEANFSACFGTGCEGVPKEILTPQKKRQSAEAFDEKRTLLAQLFIKNYERYRLKVSPEINEAGPENLV